MDELSNNHNMKTVFLLILSLLFSCGFCAQVNESFNFSQSETYYELLNDLIFNDSLIINHPNITIDGKNNSITGQFIILSENVTLKNIILNPIKNDLIIINSSSIILENIFLNNSINGMIFNFNNSLSIFLENIVFFNVSCAAKINTELNHSFHDDFFYFNNSLTSPQDFFKKFNYDSNYFFKKEYYLSKNDYFEFAENHEEFNELAQKTNNIALKGNISFDDLLIFSNDLKIKGFGNYFSLNTNKDFSIIALNEIELIFENLNFMFKSKNFMQNLGANASFSDCGFYSNSAQIFYYQVQGNSKIINSSFYSFGNSSKAIQISDGKSEINGNYFKNFKTGISLNKDCFLNDLKADYSNHEEYSEILVPTFNLSFLENNHFDLFNNSLNFYGKTYDAINQLVIDENCFYPGILKNGFYPFEIEANESLNKLKELIKGNNTGINNIFSKLIFLKEIDGFNLSWSSQKPSIINDSGFVFNPMFSEQEVKLFINFSSNSLTIKKSLDLIAKPITTIPSNRIESQGKHNGTHIIFLKNHEFLNELNFYHEAAYELKVNLPANKTHNLIVLKNNEEIFNSETNDSFFINNSFNQSIFDSSTNYYDFIWKLNYSTILHERIFVSVLNNVLIKFNQTFDYSDFFKTLHFNSFQESFIDFSSKLSNNSAILAQDLMIYCNTSKGIIDLKIPSNFYSNKQWNGKFILPKIIENNEFEYGIVDFRFLIGCNDCDLFSADFFTIMIPGRANKSVAYIDSSNNTTFLKKTDYFSIGNNLFIKTRHLSEFIIYEPIIQEPDSEFLELEEQNQSINIIDLSQEIEELDENEQLELQENKTAITSMISLNALNEAFFLKALKLAITSSLIASILLILKKNL